MSNIQPVNRVLQGRKERYESAMREHFGADWKKVSRRTKTYNVPPKSNNHAVTK